MIICILTVSAGCSSEEAVNFTEEREQLQERVNVLTKENEELRQKLKATKVEEEQPAISLQYMEKQEANRFVSKETPILLTPVKDSQVINIINPNTVVEVNDVVTVNEVVWLYVTIPVFDSPINVKGWMEEEDTELYTEDHKKLVKSPITVKAGTSIYEVDLFNQINTVEATSTENDHHCFISDQQDDYLAVGCGGGKSFVVSVKDVIFPIVDNK